MKRSWRRERKFVEGECRGIGEEREDMEGVWRRRGEE